MQKRALVKTIRGTRCLSRQIKTSTIKAPIWGTKCSFRQIKTSIAKAVLFAIRIMAASAEIISQFSDRQPYTYKHREKMTQMPKWDRVMDCFEDADASLVLNNEQC